MPHFTVYESQDITFTQLYRYEVEAASQEEAEEIAMNGGADPIVDRKIGDDDFGTSGWGFTPEEADAERVGTI